MEHVTKGGFQADPSGTLSQGANRDSKQEAIQKLLARGQTGTLADRTVPRTGY